MIIFTSFERLLIKNFIFSKKSDGFVSVLSWFSIIGIAIGVAAIIIVMSVMNGFRYELTTRILGINGHLNIYSFNNSISLDDYSIFKKNINNSRIFPLSETQAFLISDKSSKGVILRGYNNDYLDEQHFLHKNIIKGRNFDNNSNEVVIGHALAKQLNLELNDSIKIAIPKIDKTIFGNIPRFKNLNVVGIFDLGMYEYDLNFIYTNLDIANKLILNEGKFNKIEIFVKDPYEIKSIQNKLNKVILSNGLKFYSTSWKDNNSALINALNIEKNVMFLILTLIIIVASMNIISGLIIFVKEKNRDIGILKTIGLSNKSLIKIFLCIGFIIGLIGTFLGGFIGIIFSLNIKKIQFFLEYIFNISLFADEIYYLSNLPSKLNSLEVAFVLFISLFICLIATFIPAYRSIKVDPIKSLKNE